MIIDFSEAKLNKMKYDYESVIYVSLKDYKLDIKFNTLCLGKRYVSMEEIFHNIMQSAFNNGKDCKNVYCKCCGKYVPEDNVQLDYRYPLDIGGPDVIDNMIYVCPTCGKIKKYMTLYEFRKWQMISKSNKDGYFKKIIKKNKSGENRVNREWFTKVKIVDIKTSIYKEYDGYYKQKSEYDKTKMSQNEKVIILDRKYQIISGIYLFESLKQKYSDDLDKKIDVIYLENCQMEKVSFY